MREVGISLVTITVQSLGVVVRAELVREVLGARPWLCLPGARDEVPGVVVWAGRAVSLLDLARFRGGLEALTTDASRPRLVIISSGDVTLAIPADRVSEVWKTHDDNLRPRQVHDFSLARLEAVVEQVAYPLLEPELLLTHLGLEAP